MTTEMAQDLSSRRENLVDSLALFRDTVIRRLSAYKRSVNLITYEGTLPDRLALHFTKEAWARSDYRVICSVRPCMHSSLVVEVREFAASHNYPLADFQGDCSARHPWEHAVPRACENISQYIFDYLRGTHGLLLSSALLNSSTRPGFKETNTSYSGMYVFESREFAHYQVSSPDRNWHTLFLFEGFTPLDIVHAYCAFVSAEIEPHRIPICYLDCYNEREQKKLLSLVQERKTEVLALNAERYPSG